MLIHRNIEATWEHAQKNPLCWTVSSWKVTSVKSQLLPFPDSAKHVKQTSKSWPVPFHLEVSWVKLSCKTGIIQISSSAEEAKAVYIISTRAVSNLLLKHYMERIPLISWNNLLYWYTVLYSLFSSFLKWKFKTVTCCFPYQECQIHFDHPITLLSTLSIFWAQCPELDAAKLPLCWIKMEQSLTSLKNNSPIYAS